MDFRLAHPSVHAALITFLAIIYYFFKVDSRQIFEESFVDGELIFDDSLYSEEDPLPSSEWVDLFCFFVLAWIFFRCIIPASSYIFCSLVHYLVEVLQKCADAVVVSLMDMIGVLTERVELEDGAEGSDFQASPVASSAIHVAGVVGGYMDLALSSILGDETIEDISPKETKTEIAIGNILREWEQEDKDSADEKERILKESFIADSMNESSMTSSKEVIDLVNNDQVDGENLNKELESLGLPHEDIQAQCPVIGVDVGKSDQSKETKALQEIAKERGMRMGSVRGHTFMISPNSKFSSPSTTIEQKRRDLARYERLEATPNLSIVMASMASVTRREIEKLEKRAKEPAFSPKKRSKIVPKVDQVSFVYSKSPQIAAPSTVLDSCETQIIEETLPAESTPQKAELKPESSQPYISTLHTDTLEFQDSQAVNGTDADMELINTPVNELENLLQDGGMDQIEVEVACVGGEMMECIVNGAEYHGGEMSVCEFEVDIDLFFRQAEILLPTHPAIMEYTVDEAEYNGEKMSVDQVEVNMDFLFHQADTAPQDHPEPMEVLQDQEAMGQLFMVSSGSHDTYMALEAVQPVIPEVAATTQGGIEEHKMVSVLYDYTSSGDTFGVSPQPYPILQEAPEEFYQYISGSFEVHEPFSGTWVAAPQVASIIEQGREPSATINPTSYETYNSLDTSQENIPGLSEPAIDANLNLIFTIKVDEARKNKRKLEDIPATENEPRKPRMTKPLRSILKKTNGVSFPGHMVMQEPIVAVETSEEAPLKRVKKVSYALEEPEVQPNYDVARVNTQKMLNKTPSKGDIWLKERLDAQAARRGEIIGSDGFFQLGVGRAPTRRGMR